MDDYTLKLLRKKDKRMNEKKRKKIKE